MISYFQYLCYNVSVSVNNAKTIFIPIPACREYHIVQTIKSALAAAEYPDRLYFGVFNTILNNELSLLDEHGVPTDPVLHSAHVFYTEFLSPVAMGTGFSRMNASLLSDRDHDFVLQVDAHMIFDKGWDVEIINNYDIASRYTDSPFVLSNQPHGWYYKKENRDKPFIHSLGQGLTVEVDPLAFDSRKLTDYRIRSVVSNIYTDPKVFVERGNIDNIGKAWVDYGEYDQSKKIEIDGVTFHEGNCVNASQLFFSYKYLMDLLHYPKDWFYGDQINYSLRLISRGFKIFHFYYPTLITLGKVYPSKSEKVESGEINGSEDEKFNWQYTMNQKDGSSYRKSKYLKHLSTKSGQHHKDIFTGNLLGYWGAPDKESLDMAKKIMNLEDFNPL